MSYDPHRCEPSQRTFILLSVSLWTNFGYPLIDGVGLADYNSMTNGFLFSLAAPYLFVFYYFPSLNALNMGWYCGAGVFGLIGCLALSPGIALPTILNINTKKL